MEYETSYSPINDPKLMYVYGITTSRCRGVWWSGGICS